MSDALRARLVFAFLMSSLMAFLMTAWVTWLNLGLTPDFISRWLHAFLGAWPAAFCVVMALGPTVQRLTQRLLQVSGTGNRGKA